MTHRAYALAILAAAASGCGEEPQQGGGPKVARLSTDAITVGETLYLAGKGFYTPDSGGKTLLEFSGVFYWTDGDRTVPEDVPSLTIAPVYDGEFPDGGSVGGMTVKRGEQVLRWNRFGPYVGPFGANGRKPGLFKGTVTPINVTERGMALAGEPTTIAIEVRPSVLITRLEPVVGIDPSTGGPDTADCGKPALRVFGGIPYVLEVEAMGFEPSYFLYEIANINGDDRFTNFTHPATGIVDRLGEDELVMFNALPEDVDFALAAIRITAVDANNNSYATAMPVPVIRPVRVQYDGNRELAEYYDPVPVYGPIVGGIGTEVTYAETTTESRQNAVSVGFTASLVESVGSETAQNWGQGYGVTNETAETNSTENSFSEAESSSETYGTEYTTSEGTSVELGSETGTEWGWSVVEGTTSEQYQEDMNHLFGETSGSVETQVGGEASLPGLGGVSGHVGTTVGASVEAGRETTTGARTGQSSEHGSSMSSSESNSQVYGSTTTDAVSESLSGTYGVERQSSINTARAETNATAESTTYEIGASSSVTEGYEVGSSESWEESWVSTTEQSSLLSFSGKVPNGRCAVIYRQTVRYVRTAEMYRYDMCGVRTTIGELVFNEWSWSPNIAIGDDCEANLPASTQPKAECFKACE